MRLGVIFAKFGATVPRLQVEDAETSRAADCLKKVIAADFQGTLQCDAYLAYGSFVKNHARQVTLAGCWAHARRNFYEAREQAPQRCGWILRQIGHLYRIEENLRRSRAGPRKRAAERMSQSRPICERLHRALVLLLRLGLSLLTLAAAIFAALPAPAQQITGTPGSPGATTTISGNQLPAPDPKFWGFAYPAKRINSDHTADLIETEIDEVRPTFPKTLIARGRI